MFLYALEQNKENILSKYVHVAKVKVYIFKQLVYLNMQVKIGAERDLSI